MFEICNCNGIDSFQVMLENLLKAKNAFLSVIGVRRDRAVSENSFQVVAFLISVLLDRIALADPWEVWTCLQARLIFVASVVILSAIKSSSKSFIHSSVFIFFQTLP